VDRYTITRPDWMVMAYGAVVGAALLGYASSASLPPIIIGAINGFFAGAVIVALHKFSGFDRCPKTPFRSRMQKGIFVALFAIVVYALVDRALRRDWFVLGVLLFVSVPFALLSRGLIARLLPHKLSANPRCTGAAKSTEYEMGDHSTPPRDR
jgi:hypothetical protein